MISPSDLAMEMYLQTSFEPDCDFVEGQVIARSVGGMKHSKAQADFCGIVHDQAPSLDVRPSLRMHIASRRYLVADVAVFRHEPREEYPEKPPLIVLEVAAPDDDRERVAEKLDDYRAWRVPCVWLADPYSSRLHVMTDSGCRKSKHSISPNSASGSPKKTFSRHT